MTTAVLAAALDLGFALFHLMFWRLFHWPRSLEASGALNSAITQTLNWVLIYVFTVYGAVLMWLAVSGPGVPSLLAGAGAGFWALRLMLQPWLFPMRDWQSLSITAVFVLTALLHALAAMPLPN